MATSHVTLRAIRATAVDILIARPLGTSAQSMRIAPLLLIDLKTEEGITGHAYLFCYIRKVPGLVAGVLADIHDARKMAPARLAAFVTKSQCRPKVLSESQGSGICAARRQHCSHRDSSLR